MRWLACFGAATAIALAQSGALLPNPEALKLETRAMELMESTGVAVPSEWGKSLQHMKMSPALADSRLGRS